MPTPSQDIDLATLLDALPDGVSMFSPDRRCLYANRAALEALSSRFGIPPGSVIGAYLSELPFPPSYLREVEELVARASAGESLTQEVLAPTASGARWVEHKRYPVRGKDGAMLGIASVVRDVHD